MATSKAPLFDETSYHQSLWSKARAHPARIIILTYLLQNGTTSFHELCKILPLARTTVSQHMRSLRNGGFVKLYEHYPHSFYQIDPHVCRDFAKKIKPIDDLFMNDTSGNI